MQTPFTSVPTLVLIEYPRYENTDRTPLVAYWLVIPIHQEGGRQFYVKGIDYWLEFIDLYFKNSIANHGYNIEVHFISKGN